MDEVLETETSIDRASCFHYTSVETLLARYGRNGNTGPPNWWPADDRFLRNRGVLSLGMPGFTKAYFGELVERFNVRHVVELGCNAGSSSIVWGHYLGGSEGTHTTVDSWQHSRYTRFFLDFLLHLFEIQNVTVVEGDLRMLDRKLEAFPVERREFDLLSIDADHSFESVAKDLRFQKLVRVGGYILFDDYGNSPVTDFVDEVMPGLEAFELIEKRRFVPEMGLEGHGIRSMKNYGTALFRKTADSAYDGASLSLASRLRTALGW